MIKEKLDVCFKNTICTGLIDCYFGTYISFLIQVMMLQTNNRPPPSNIYLFFATINSFFYYYFFYINGLTFFNPLQQIKFSRKYWVCSCMQKKYMYKSLVRFYTVKIPCRS